MTQSSSRIVRECLPSLHKAPDSVPITVDKRGGGEEEEEEGKLVEGRKRGIELALFL